MHYLLTLFRLRCFQTKSVDDHREHVPVVALLAAGTVVVVVVVAVRVAVAMALVALALVERIAAVAVAALDDIALDADHGIPAVAAVLAVKTITIRITSSQHL